MQKYYTESLLSATKKKLSGVNHGKTFVFV
jgi:hypothetical protein